MKKLVFIAILLFSEVAEAYDYEFTNIPDCKIYSIKKERHELLTKEERSQFRESLCPKFSDYSKKVIVKKEAVKAITQKTCEKPKTEYETWDESEFRKYIKSVYKKAISIGVERSVARNFLDNVKYLPSVKNTASNQPEVKKNLFEYIATRTAPDFMNTLRKKTLEKSVSISNIFNDLEEIFGVERSIMMSLWMIETNFTGFTGRTPIISALATMAFKNPRRCEFFEKNLIDFLKMVHFGHIEIDAKGAWDGGIGGIQFMPQTFMKYALDYDGDGRIDLYKSEGDMMASLSNYLHTLAWEKNGGMMTEVLLPDSFDYCLVGYLETKAKMVKEWKKLGIKLASSKFGAKYIKQNNKKAWLVIPDKTHISPTGCRPSAFLVYENYGHILDWNRTMFGATVTAIYQDEIEKILSNPKKCLA